MRKLVVEYKKGFQPSKDTIRTNGGVIMFTPDIDEDYWIMRVKLYHDKLLNKDQSIVAFPKFGLIGVGFAIEEGSWNTNFPYDVEAERLYEHIKINKKYRVITKQTCLKGLKMLQEACRQYEEDRKAKESIKVNVNSLKRRDY